MLELILVCNILFIFFINNINKLNFKWKIREYKKLPFILFLYLTFK